ncbi:MAG: hypothetical protein AB9866_07095 [Syntrophobacteraceae bacterium]
MGSLSDFAENKLLDHIFNAAYVPAATIYLALCTDDPTDVGTGAVMNEVANANNYARTAIAFSPAASRAVMQNGAVTFPQASGAWGSVTHWAIVDSATYGVGNMLASGAFSAALNVVANNIPSVPNGEIQISIAASSGAGFTDYTAHKLLDLMFRNQAFAKPGTYLALCNAVVADADVAITEVTGTSYARKQVNTNGGASPTWDLAASGALDNTHDIVFPTPGAGDWTQIAALAIMDAAIDGNILAFDNDNIVDQTPASGQTVQFVAGAFDVSLS